MWVARESLEDRMGAEVVESSGPPVAGEPAQETFEFFGEEAEAGGGEAAPPLLPRLETQVAEKDTASNDTASNAPESASADGGGRADAASASRSPAPDASAAEADGSRSIEPAAEQATAGPGPEDDTQRRDRAARRRANERAAQAAPAAEAAASAPQSEAEQTPGAGAVVIQVLSSSEETQASALVERLRSDGYRAFLSPVEVDGKTMYRVRVGPYQDRAAAEVDADKIKRAHRLDTWFPRS
jgi:DedD protein